MENLVKDMVLVGFHHFTSKDKSKTYYVVQCLYSEIDESRGNMKGTMLNIFTDEETYRKVIGLNIGVSLKVQIMPNLSEGKIFYKVVI